MRVSRLDLLRFGKFTDSSIRFGEHEAGQPDLHIIYGPNEAGKSTLMAAYLDFLFGFPTRTPYTFIHNGPALKVGAVLDIDNEIQEFRRVKKNKNSLLDKNDAPTDDKIILQRLAGLTKESYASMFSLNDEGLEKGGESILASEGDLGKLLYSATTGVAQLSESLIDLRTNTAKFYAKGKQKFELAELKKRLKDIEAERKVLDTEAAGYTKLVKELAETEKQYKELDVKHDNLKQEMRKLQTKIDAAPQLQSIQRIQAKLEPLLELPEPPKNWFEEVRDLQLSIVEIETREKDLDKNLSQLNESLSKIEQDETALSAKSQWQLVAENYDHYRIAAGNLPELEREASVCDSEIRNCLHKLDKTQIDKPQSLLLNSSTQATIQGLIQDHQPLLALLDSAKKELVRASGQSDELQDRFAAEGGLIEKDSTVITSSNSGSAMAALELEVEGITAQNIVARRQSAEQQLNVLNDELVFKMTSLNPWSGDSEALQSLTIPHVSELDLLKQRRDTLKDQRSKQEHIHQTANNQLESLRSRKNAHVETGVVDDAESIKLRQARDQAWVEHRHSLKENTADIFETAMRADDASHSTRLQQTEALAQLRLYSREMLETQDELKQSERRLDELTAEEEKFTKDQIQLIALVSPKLNAAMSIEAMKSWIDSYENALQVVQKIRKANREIDDIDRQTNVACENLSRCLSNVGSSLDVIDSGANANKLSELLKAAISTMKRDAVLSGLRDQLNASLYELKTRKDAVQSAEEALNAWGVDWREGCSSCWIGEDGGSPTPIVVSDYLGHLSIMDQQLVELSNVSGKIKGHKDTATAFIQSIEKLAATIELDSTGLAADQLYQAVQVRIEAAVDAKTRVNALEENLVVLQKDKDKSQEALLVKTKQTEKMFSFFNVLSLTDVELKLNDVNTKIELTEQFESIEENLTGTLKLSSIENVYEELSGFDSDKAQLDFEKLQVEAKSIESELQRAHTTRDHARQAVEDVGGDEAVARLVEQRENILLETEEKATEYLQKHLALIAADAALKKYRDTHRSTMMQSASNAFSEISQGHYTGLDTIQDGASEKLIAIDRDGKTKQSDQMSKGTRFQLYLALRVAGYHEYTRSRPAVPFIADDIMETSDDERAACTFRVLGDMAKVGQVIYLTHHQHLCDIAKSVVPNTKIHNL